MSPTGLWKPELKSKDFFFPLQTNRGSQATYNYVHIGRANDSVVKFSGGLKGTGSVEVNVQSLIADWIFKMRVGRGEKSS
jgi:hypothetical protein